MRLFLAAVMASVADPAMAWNICDDLWFTRNAIYDRAGYCFNSDLGRAVFDNAGCTPGEVRLTGQAARDVTAIQQYEQELSCDVDTARKRLDIPDLDLRMSLRDLPLPSPFASACYGWRGPQIMLHAGRDERTAVTGVINPGDDLVWTFDGSDGWAFMQDHAPGGGLGWYREPAYRPQDCVASAG